jgi:hypothetical protein
MPSYKYCHPMQELHIKQYIFSPINPVFTACRSKLRYVDILNAGQGRYRGRLNTTSGVETLGVPPEMSHITVANSAMNGKEYS